ncbi:Nance-Horan syndrome protein-like isoform X2 [Sphaeramia orbicularis]|uniref:Nance-Horan syndrome protein-like isoform X2 n=1 Tax=Sphaeramia orbicularis TaxID=375764 RepID=UPI00117E2C0D|nr:Nance-Horan syndrome protein-like isoform X2 [Sphaeramia orbicularis]XP_029978886.1 Nance-Horan syndrome protein-like isoform X2 [Sphaeramia orbicularis]
MPFAKRIVEPQLLCRHQIPNDEGLLFEDLCAISNVVLSRTLRQLSDLARHACSLFQELENDIINTNQRVWVLQNKIGQIQQTASALDPKKEAVPVSNLDIESKLSVHYQAPWHQQHNVFHPCTRPPCLEELHRNAQLSLRALHRDEQQHQRSTSRERNRVTISISVAPPMPTFPSPHTIRRQQRSRLARAQERAEREQELDYQPRKERTVKETEIQTIQRKERSGREAEVQRKFACFYSLHPIDGCNFIPWNRKATSTGDSDGGEVLGGHKAKASATNAPATQDKQTNWSKENQPAGDQKSTGDPNSISSCIIPINVTGVGFDREASARCSLVHSQSVLQRRRKLRRRKTITGIPKRVQQDMDSDESPVARERTVIVHANPHQLSLCQEDLSISGRLSHTRDSGCQTDDFLIACTAAPSRRRIRAQRGHQGIPASLSHSTGNISSLGDQSESTYTTAAAHGGRLRSRSLPREGGRLMDSDEDDDDNYDDDDEDEELSPYEAEDFIPPGPSPRMKMMMMKDEEESTDDQAAPEPLQLGSLKRLQRSGDRDRGGGGGGSPEHSWMERGRSRLPRKADMGSCEISSSSDTFSSPIHSVSTTGVLGSHVDHKEDHQSSSGNWSGSSSTCPSQTSETIPPPSSPPLTGSSHCDSELSLNTVPNAIDEGFSLDPSYHSDLRPQGQGHRSSSFTSSATDQLDDAGVSTASEGEWTYPPDQDQTDPDQDPDQTQNMSQSHDLSQEYSPKQGLQDQSCFTDKTSNTEKDPVSHYPSDTEGFYFSSVHSGECNQSYRNYMYNYADQGPEFGQNNTVAAPLPHGVYPQPSAGFRAGTMTLGRPCRPLRKPKVKPPPPKRTSSLKESSSSVDVGTDTQADHDQPKMVSEQELSMSSTDMKLELELELEGGPEQLQTSCLVAEPLGTWGMGLRETVDIVEPMSFSSADTHSFKDEGAVQSDYADLWLHNNEMKSNNGEYTSMSNSSTATGTTVMECIKSPESSSSSTETQTQSLGQASENRPASPPLPPGDFKLGSPEKLAGLASPSSGYSSQSETPTSTLPSSSAAFFPGPLSPSTGKRKPKVPERKSSLSSLQHFPRDGASISSGYKRDPDFPPPPSQLDLSILHGGHARHTLSHRTHHMHTLHYSKHRVANVLNTGSKLLAPEVSSINPPPSSVSAPSIPSSNLLVATPSTIRAVQLHSISQSTDSATATEQETAVIAETATRPKCPPSGSTLAPPPFNTRPLPPRRPPPRPPAQEHTSSPEHSQPPPPGRHPDGPPSYESLLLRQDRYGPGTFWAMTAFRTRMDPSSEEDSSPLHRPVPRAPHPSPVDLHTHIHSHTEFRGLTHSGHAHPEFRVLGERSFSQDDDDDEDDEEEEEEQVKEPPGLPVRAACSRVSMRPDHPPPPAYEFAGGYHSDSGPWASPVKVPGTIVETSQPYLISDARRGIQEEQGEEEEVTSGATRSAHQQQSQESKDDSTTPDTEDYFSKDSTPSDNSLSPLTDDTKVDDDIIITSPNKTRTTEDLFAMIHRSKRKVLGRKDSGDLNAKSRLCPPAPVTTGSVPAIAIPPAPPLNIPATLASAAGSQRAPVPIYRSAKKSNTSNEEFKLLLLKKGSRSDSSYRMSATEILKSPITPKTPGDSLHEGPIRPTDEIPSTLQESPLSGLEPIQIPGLFPRANSESFTPKTLPMSAASRQGRSRIPPVANSSRYSTRSRLYTAPMQAISEGETENSDGSPHDDRSS